MDFGLAEEYRAFRDGARRWVDAEAPKAWARELERDEHNYPFALWDKFTAAGFHGIGIAEEFGGQGGDVLMQMLLARELARTHWAVSPGSGASPRLPDRNRSGCTGRPNRRLGICR